MRWKAVRPAEINPIKAQAEVFAEPDCRIKANAPLPGFKLRPVSFAYIGYPTLRVGRHMGVAASLRNE
jgi:hypothetical protein